MITYTAPAAVTWIPNKIFISRTEALTHLRTPALPQKSMAKTRTLLAKDALAAVLCGSLTVSETVDVELGFNQFYIDSDENLREHMDVTHPMCACAVGGLAVAYVSRFNNVKVGAWKTSVGKKNDWLFKSLLHKFFSRLQIQMIEAAFVPGFEKCFSENDSGLLFTKLRDLRDSRLKRKLQVASKFTGTRVNPEFRFIRIMENIVLHRGMFVP